MTQILLTYLPNWEVEIFTSDQELEGFLELGIEAKFPIYHYHRFWQRMRRKPFDICLYNIEDLVEIEFIEKAIQLWPGVCFLHDLSLSTLVLSRFSHSTAGIDVDQFLTENCGDAAPPIGRWKVMGWNSEIFFKLLPLAQKIIEKPFHLITSNDYQAKKSIEIGAEIASVISLPLPFNRTDRHDIRWDIGFTGIDPISDRTTSILESLSVILNEDPRLEVLWLVTSNDERQRALEILSAKIPEEFEKIQVVIAAEFDEAISEISRCRIWIGVSGNDTHGLSLPSLIAVTIGVPTIGSSNAQWNEVAKGSFLRVELGRFEVPQLIKAASELLISEDLRNQLQYACCANHHRVDDFFEKLELLLNSLAMKSELNWEARMNQYQSASASLQRLTEESLHSEYDSERADVVAEILDGVFV